MKTQISKQPPGKKTPAFSPHPAGKTTAAAKLAPQAGSSFDDLHARIAGRAYELYVGRDCQDGHAVEDWLEAEREILSREFPE